MNRLSLAVEEIFVNIASYAYPQSSGTREITFRFSGDPVAVEIGFADRGEPFDPVKGRKSKKGSTGERVPGGLGILIVKKVTDEMSYRYETGRNILTIRKTIG